MFLLLRPAAPVLRLVAPHLPWSKAASDAPAASPPTTGPIAPPSRRTPRKPPAADAKVQTLWCEPGEHEWQRPSAPGRKPKACAAHA